MSEITQHLLCLLFVFSFSLVASTWGTLK